MTAARAESRTSIILMDKSKPVTTIEFINFSAELLKEKNISEPRLTSELMLCEIMNCSRVNLYLNFDKPLKKSESDLLKDYLNRRIGHEPLQYIFGKTSFYGLDIKVNSKVLIPRPETELLVEYILKDIKESGKSEVSMIEIGSGSGCISVALAKQLETMNVNYNIFSIDISSDATEVANENLRLNDLSSNKIRFITKDLFEIERLHKSVDYIISNPPYISLNEFEKLDSEVKDHEPDFALTDFNDGLKYYRKIFSIAAEDNFKGKVFCEIGFGQKDSIESIVKSKGFNNCIFYNDYNDIPRIVKSEK